MLRIAILDDEPRIGFQLRDALKAIDSTLQIDAFTAWKELREYLSRYAHVDAVFMDLQFDNHIRSGIDYAEEILCTHPETKILYITGYPMDYIQKVFLSKNVQPRGFIMKPFQTDVLKTHIVQLTEERMSDKELLPFKAVGSTIEYLSLPHLLYLSSRGRCVTAHTQNGLYTGYYKLSELAEQLPAYFYQCHKSYLINLHKIQRIEARHVLIQNQQIPLSNIGSTTIAEKRMEIIRLKSQLHKQEVQL